MLEDYTVIDLEMTGLNVKTDAIIETGAVRVRGGEIADTYSALIFTGRRPGADHGADGDHPGDGARRTGAGGGDGGIFCVCGGGYPRRAEYYF